MQGFEGDRRMIAVGVSTVKQVLSVLIASKTDGETNDVPVFFLFT